MLSLVLILSSSGVCDSPTVKPATMPMEVQRPFFRGFENHPFKVGMTLSQFDTTCTKMGVVPSYSGAGNGKIYVSRVLEYEARLYWDECLRLKSIEKIKLIYHKQRGEHR